LTLAGISYPSDFSGKKYFYVPVGILSLSAYLALKNFKTEIIDYQHFDTIKPYDPESIFEFLSSASSKIIGISIMTKDLPGTLIACGMLKKAEPDRVIILGGPGPTGAAKSIIEKFDSIDFVVRGEGEHTLSELMETIRDGGKFDKIAGLVFRQDGRVISNPTRPRIENPDAIPLPDYSKIDKLNYNIVYIPSTRGCSHFCTFCDQPALWQGREIRRSLDSLFSEIDFITQKLSAKWEIAFSDNEFCADPARFEEFSRRYREKGYKFGFSMDRRIDSIDEHFLQESRRINCNLILYGVESGSGKVLKEIRKGFSPESIKPGLMLSSGYMLNSIASFMFSYPFETLADFLDTANIIYSMWNEKTSNFITFQLHYLSPLPRTPIFEKYKNMIIRRRVSNLMVTKRNETQYDSIIDNSLKKAAVLPKKLDNTETAEDPMIEQLITENPDICSGFYLYDSPGLHLKELVIECLKSLFTRQLRTAVFSNGENIIYFDGKRIRVAGKSEDKDAPALITKISIHALENQGELFEQIKESGKTEIMIVFNEDSLPVETKTGDTIFSMLENMRLHGLHPFLPYPLQKPGYFRFTTKLKMQSQFRMPISCNSFRM
jgi:radical SAM superfamily enzyme YgiQ (UPF0313 family)